MTETFFEKLVQERQFAGILQTHARVFFRLTNSLLAAESEGWNKKHFFQLLNEADNLESFLDDYGARYNRTYAFLTELVASVRWFAHAGYSIAHLLSRFDSYGTSRWDLPGDGASPEPATRDALDFVRETAVDLMTALRAEAGHLGLEITPESFPEANFMPVVARRSLPRNVGQADLVDEEQKIAELATSYLRACKMLRDVGVRPIEDPEERHRMFTRGSTEAQARVYESTVHNIQSTYDTHVQNTVLEARDERLAQLRGHVSAALHLLEAVTHMAHFIERHEDHVRSEEAKQRISELVEREGVERVTWNVLLYWARRFLEAGESLAEDLLPEYTNLLEMALDLPDGLALHARPAALIVGVVNHYGTPVEMELAGQSCNAGSILELLVAVGSHPGATRFLFRGDERPVRDIQTLFRNGLGEEGLDDLPDHLGYLRPE